MSVKEQTRDHVARKKRPSDRKEARFDLRSEAAWMARVERQAARFSLTVTGYIRRAVSKELEADEATDPRLKEGGR